MEKLKVGDRMPNLTFTTSTGRKLTTEQAIGGKRTVFWVLRYIGCPVCRYDVHVLIQRYDEFRKRNTQVYVVMQSDPAVLADVLKDEKIPFEIICDPDMTIYKTLAVPTAKDMNELIPQTGEDAPKWEQKQKDFTDAGFAHGKYEGDEMQLPAFFIVKGDGVITEAHYAKDVVDMPSVDEVTAMLDKER